MHRLALLLATLVWASVACADAANFTLVNGTDGALADLSIRRAGTQDWKSLGAAPAAGARSPVSFSDRDCAFDIRANLAGAGPVTWSRSQSMRCEIRRFEARRIGRCLGRLRPVTTRRLTGAA